MTIESILSEKESQTFEVKSIQVEFGEGMDHICREQEAKGAQIPTFRTDDFILKITVPKIGEKIIVRDTETSQKTSKIIIVLISDDPYVTTSKMADMIGVDRRNIARNIKKLQVLGVVRRVGPDKGGFWEILTDRPRK